MLLSCQGGTARESEQMISSETRDAVFMHINHGGDDPHRLLMALHMAVLMSETQDVLVYIDIKGVEAIARIPKVRFSELCSPICRLNNSEILQVDMILLVYRHFYVCFCRYDKKST